MSAGKPNTKKEVLRTTCCAYLSAVYSREYLHTHLLVQAAVLEDILIDTLVNTQDILYFVDHGLQRPCMHAISEAEVQASTQAMAKVVGHAIIVHVAKGTSSTFTSVFLCFHALGLSLYSGVLQVDLW